MTRPEAKGKGMPCRSCKQDSMQMTRGEFDLHILLRMMKWVQANNNGTVAHLKKKKENGSRGALDVCMHGQCAHKFLYCYGNCTVYNVHTWTTHGYQSIDRPLRSVGRSVEECVVLVTRPLIQDPTFMSPCLVW